MPRLGQTAPTVSVAVCPGARFAEEGCAVMLGVGTPEGAAVGATVGVAVGAAFTVTLHIFDVAVYGMPFKLPEATHWMVKLEFAVKE